MLAPRCLEAETGVLGSVAVTLARRAASGPLTAQLWQGLPVAANGPVVASPGGSPAPSPPSG